MLTKIAKSFTIVLQLVCSTFNLSVKQTSAHFLDTELDNLFSVLESIISSRFTLCT